MRYRRCEAALPRNSKRAALSSWSGWRWPWLCGGGRVLRARFVCAPSAVAYFFEAFGAGFLEGDALWQHMGLLTRLRSGRSDHVTYWASPMERVVAHGLSTP